MATLKHLSTNTHLPLAARHIIGRSHMCQLQIRHTSVSAVHAELAWDGKVWRLRDLGSRNGTFIAGQRVPAGQAVVLEPGMELGFGVPESLYRFVDDAAPRLIAFSEDESRVAEHDILCLPSTSECEVMILRDGDERWVLESSEGTRPLEDESSVVVAGKPWQIHLPSSVLPTREAASARGEALDECVFEFMVSRDGEHVEIRLHHADHVRSLEPRAHAFLLLALARARLQDAAQGRLPEGEHGWMHREDLMKELTIDLHLLNLWVYRARQQLIQAKLCDASKIIERREQAGQLRLGLRHLRVIDA